MELFYPFTQGECPGYGGHWAFLLWQAAEPIAKLKIQNSKLRSAQQFKTQNSKFKTLL